MSSLADRLATLRIRIEQACAECARDPHGIELLPVSKRMPLSLIREAAGLGFRRFGENYVQEALQKALDADDLDFVLIGPLQRNKAKPALLHFRELMTVDRPELATRLRHLAAELDLVRPVWLQLDLWGEASKQGGCGEAELDELFAALEQDPRLPVQGFMAIPPPEDPGAFRQLATLRDQLQQRHGRSFRLSMGMSSDLEEAIAAGSDQIRIGTAFFGDR
jgi:pyridoxal phosphate enzyme (YggS family)